MAQLKLTSETNPMLGQVYMLSILIIHMKHFPWSPNNDSSFFTSLNFDALKLKFGNRRYRQYIQCFLERLNKGILSTYIYNIFIYLSTLCSKRYATEWRRNANDGRSNFHRQTVSTLYKRVRPCRLTFLIILVNTLA